MSIYSRGLDRTDVRVQAGNLTPPTRSNPAVTAAVVVGLGALIFLGIPLIRKAQAKATPARTPLWSIGKPSHRTGLGGDVRAMLRQREYGL